MHKIELERTVVLLPLHIAKSSYHSFKVPQETAFLVIVAHKKTSHRAARCGISNTESSLADKCHYASFNDHWTAADGK